MAKLKLAAGQKKSKSSTAKSIRGAVPCLVLIVAGIALLCLMFYLSLQSGTL
jgi:hypothetical protein